MEVERQRYIASADEKGRPIPGSEQRVGPQEKFEFGGPGDSISSVVQGGYTSNWNPDFLQRELGKDGTCARLYFDKRVAVDIGDPEAEISKTKRKLLFKHGFGYLCIPTGFSKNPAKLKELYDIALEEYWSYEKRHPRPTAVQEAVIVDSKGATRRAFMTAIDIRVGGGIIGNVEQQAAELKEATKLSKKEIKTAKLHSKLHRKLRQSVSSGKPFRNPFVAKGQRLYPVKYSS